MRAACMCASVRSVAADQTWRCIASRSGTTVFYGVVINQPARHAAFDGPGTVCRVCARAFACVAVTDAWAYPTRVAGQMWTISMMQTNPKRFASEIKAAVVSRRRISIVADYAVFDAVKNYR